MTKGTRRLRIIFIVLIALLVSSLAFGGYFFYKYKFNAISESASKKEAEKLFSKISDIYYFPEGEKPAIATVSDPSIFSGQGYFESAQIGDAIFIFAGTKRAVLYRPSIDKIIDVAPMTDEDISNINSANNINSQVQ